MLYLANFSNWGSVSIGGVASRATAYDILRLTYPTSQFVPNMGYDLKIFGASDLYSPLNLTTPVLAITTSYEINASKNSVNAKDYILSAAGPVQIFFEVG